MRKMTRHASVFCLMLVAATVVSMSMPHGVDANDVFLYFTLAFVVYLAGSYFWDARRHR